VQYEAGADSSWPDPTTAQTGVDIDGDCSTQARLTGTKRPFEG
jgi:hypothetical protein